MSAQQPSSAALKHLGRPRHAGMLYAIGAMVHASSSLQHADHCIIASVPGHKMTMAQARPGHLGLTELGVCTLMSRSWTQLPAVLQRRPARHREIRKSNSGCSLLAQGFNSMPGLRPCLEPHTSSTSLALCVQGRKPHSSLQQHLAAKQAGKASVQTQGSARCLPACSCITSVPLP